MVKGQMDIKDDSVELETLYLSMHMHHMKTHIFRDDMSISRSPFKVRG